MLPATTARNCGTVPPEELFRGNRGNKRVDVLMIAFSFFFFLVRICHRL